MEDKKCYSCEEIFRVGYILGIIDKELESKFGDEYKDIDMDELFEIAEKIYNEWDNMIDIKNIGEEGYIQEYAQRKWREKIKNLIEKLRRG